MKYVFEKKKKNAVSVLSVLFEEVSTCLGFGKRAVQLVQRGWGCSRFKE